MEFVLILSNDKQFSNLLNQGFMPIIVYIIAFIAIIFSIVLMYKQRELIRSRDKYHYKTKSLESQLEQKEREITQFQYRLQHLKNESSKEVDSSVLNKIQNLEVKVANNEKETIETDIKIEWIPEEFYLSTPSKEGAFIGKSMYEFNASKAIYKVITKSADMAFFQIVCNEAIINDVLNDPDTLLEPVCEYDGGANLKAKSIKPIKDGMLKKVNGIWKVEKRAIIKFI